MIASLHDSVASVPQASNFRTCRMAAPHCGPVQYMSSEAIEPTTSSALIASTAGRWSSRKCAVHPLHWVAPPHNSTRSSCRKSLCESPQSAMVWMAAQYEQVRSHPLSLHAESEVFGAPSSNGLRADFARVTFVTLRKSNDEEKSFGLNFRGKQFHAV